MRNSSSMKLVAIYFICVGIVAIIAILIYGCNHTPAVKTTDIYTKQSDIQPGRTVIYGGGAEPKGYLQPSRIDPRVTVEYDKKGNVKGYWKQDPVDARKMRFYKKK